MLADSLPYGALQIQHPEYARKLPAYTWLAKLRAGPGDSSLTARDLLPQLPGERAEVYEARLANFAYTPILANAIREFGAKLQSAPLSVSQPTPAWAEFLTSVDGKGQAIAACLGEVFSSLLWFGSVALGVSAAPAGPGRSLAEAPLPPPYLIRVDAPHLINWGDGWQCTHQIDRAATPDGVSYTARWQYWGSHGNRAYGAPCKLSRSGQIQQLLINGKWVGASQKLLIPALGPLYPGTPLVRAELPPELWAGGNCWLKQLQHTRIESSWTSSGLTAGQIQRLYTPHVQPKEDPRQVVSATQPDFGNASVLIGGDYRVIETTGEAVATLTGQLQTIEYQVRSLVSMGWLAKQGAQLQSGESKKLDSSLLQNTMRDYGQRVRQLIADALVQVAAYLGTEPPAVTGLDTFSTSEVEDVIAMAPGVQAIAGLPLTTRKVWLSKVSELLTGTLPPDLAAQVRQEIDAVTALTP